MVLSNTCDPGQPFPHRPPEIDRCVDRFLTVMCNSSRRYILELLASPQEEPNGLTEKRSGEIAELISLSPTTTSEHLSLLSSLGLVRSRREGTSVYYCIADHLIAQTFHDLLAAFDSHCASWSAYNEKAQADASYKE